MHRHSRTAAESRLALESLEVVIFLELILEVVVVFVRWLIRVLFLNTCGRFKQLLIQTLDFQLLVQLVSLLSPPLLRFLLLELVLLVLLLLHPTVFRILLLLLRLLPACRHRPLDIQPTVAVCIETVDRSVARRVVPEHSHRRSPVSKQPQPQRQPSALLRMERARHETSTDLDVAAGPPASQSCTGSQLSAAGPSTSVRSMSTSSRCRRQCSSRSVERSAGPSFPTDTPRGGCPPSALTQHTAAVELSSYVGTDFPQARTKPTRDNRAVGSSRRRQILRVRRLERLTLRGGDRGGGLSPLLPVELEEVGLEIVGLEQRSEGARNQPINQPTKRGLDSALLHRPPAPQGVR